LNRTSLAGFKPSGANNLVASFTAQPALPFTKTRIPEWDGCSCKHDLFEEAVLVIHHHHGWKSRNTQSLLTIEIGEGWG